MKKDLPLPYGNIQSKKHKRKTDVSILIDVCNSFSTVQFNAAYKINLMHYAAVIIER